MGPARPPIAGHCRGTATVRWFRDSIPRSTGYWASMAPFRMEARSAPPPARGRADRARHTGTGQAKYAMTNALRTTNQPATMPRMFRRSRLLRRTGSPLMSPAPTHSPRRM